MPRYQYTPLNAELGELRLLELHPGALDDPIKISVFKAPFAEPEPQVSQRKSTAEIQQSLPNGWTVWETAEERTIFLSETQAYSTWDHPDPNYDRAWYESTDAQSIASFEPKYEALSYTWGSLQDQAKIEIVPSLSSPTCSNQTSLESHAELPVGQNLYDALKHLRKPAASRILWIDALCINQSDLDERNRQVGRMGSIYKHAQRVVIWLGCGSPNSDLALRTLSYLGEQIEYTKNDFWLPAPNRTEIDWWQNAERESLILYDMDTWQAVSDLSFRPWFERLWVMQEIQLANPYAVVQCGLNTVSWNLLRRAFRKCWELGPAHNASQALLLRLELISKLCKSLKNDDPRLLLIVTRGLMCSEPRDRVYALLGMFPPAFSQHIHADYSEPIEEVYKRVFITYAEFTNSLYMLCGLGSSPSTSWLPDWSRRYDGIPYTASSLASGSSVAEYTYDAPSTLRVTGVSYDTITDVAGPLSHDPDECFTALHEFWLTGPWLNQMYPTGETMTEACAWVLRFGQLLNRHPQMTYPTLTEAKHPFQKLIDGGAIDAAQDHPSFEWEKPHGKTPFKTQKGYIGLTNGRPQPGDKICVLLGCRLPLLLREDPSHHNFRIIGDAYLHGLMDGQALLGPLPKQYKVVFGLEHTAARPNSHSPIFMDTALSQGTYDDPRLGAIPPDWEKIPETDNLWPSIYVWAWRNTNTGRVLKDGDPRMLSHALRARGVPLEVFPLV